MNVCMCICDFVYEMILCHLEFALKAAINHYEKIKLQGRVFRLIRWFKIISVVLSATDKCLRKEIFDFKRVIYYYIMRD